LGYRNRLEIIADILRAAGDGAKKTRIMYFANLSYSLLEKYLAVAIKADLLVDNGGKYGVTEKGRVFLEKFNDYSKKVARISRELKTIKFEKRVLEQMCEIP